MTPCPVNRPRADCLHTSPANLDLTLVACAHRRSNPEHLLSKKRIEEGDGLPDLLLTTTCDAALKKCGFDIIESRDAALAPNPGGEAWYTILTPSYWSFFRLQFTPWGARPAVRPMRLELSQSPAITAHPPPCDRIPA